MNIFLFLQGCVFIEVLYPFLIFTFFVICGVEFVEFSPK